MKIIKGCAIALVTLILLSVVLVDIVSLSFIEDIIGYWGRALLMLVVVLLLLNILK